MESEQKEPSIRCSNCNLVQFLRSGKGKCRRCGRQLLMLVPESVDEPLTHVIDEPFIRRFETCVCLVIRQLRIKAKLKQHQVMTLAEFGSRTYISKIENPSGHNRTVPTLKSIEKFSKALNVDVWKIISMAEKEAARSGCNDWYRWWDEIVPLLRGLRRKEQMEVLAAVRRIGEGKKELPVKQKSA